MAQPILHEKRALTVAALALGVVVFYGKPAQAQFSGANRTILLLGADYGAPDVTWGVGLEIPYGMWRW